jgi:acetylserotonin N-methyltransferase
MPPPGDALEPPTADQRLIWDIYFSAHVMPLVAECDELGAFALIAETPLSSAEAAERLGIAAEWAEILLGALAAVGLMRVQDGHFHITDATRCYLLPSSPYYAGFTLRRFAGRNIYERLKAAVHAPPAVEPAPAEPGSSIYVVRDWKESELSVERVQDGVRTMHGLSFAAAVGMARSVDFGGVHRLLDVAGGAGGFAIALAQRYPELRCTVAELPAVCQLTQGYIARYGVEDRVDTLPLNMFFDVWPSGYDGVFFSCVLHDWDLEHRTVLIQRAYAALPSGGRIFIHEMLLGDAADGPLAPALYSLSMRIGTQGKQFTAPELRTALESAGFGRVAVHNTYGDFSVVSGEKP